MVVFGYEIREIRVFETREVFSSFFFFPYMGLKTERVSMLFF